MKRTQLLMIGTLLSAPLLALADQVTCESVNNRRAECDMNTRGEVRLVRQISKTTCVENTNWGVSRSSIWVDRGCAAVFASGDSLDSGSAGASSRGGVGPDRVTCESVDDRRVECDMNTSGRVVVARQLSKTHCVENTNWGANRSSIWVDGGCRAVFAREGGRRRPALARRDRPRGCAVRQQRARTGGGHPGLQQVRRPGL